MIPPGPVWLLLRYFLLPLPKIVGIQKTFHPLPDLRVVEL